MSEFDSINYQSPSFPEPPIKLVGAIPRLLTFLIDLLIATLIGIAITYPFSSLMGSMEGIRANFPIIFFLIYFTIFDSSILKGRSFGRRLFSSQVQHDDGSFLSPTTAFSRSLLLFSPIIILSNLPFFGNIIFEFIKGPYSDKLAVILLIILPIGLIGIGNGFFLLFHPQKRGIHDLYFKCLIIKSGETNPLPIDWTTNSLKAGFLGFIIFSLFGFSLFVNQFSAFKSINIEGTKNFINLLEKESRINGISISFKNISFKESNTDEIKTIKMLVTTIPVTTEGLKNEQFHNELVAKLSPLIEGSIINMGIDGITINFVTIKYIGFLRTKSGKSYRKLLRDINIK